MLHFLKKISNTKHSIVGCLVFIFLSLNTFAQFAPGVGQAGTTALYKDSSAFTGWATSCKLTRGLQDISNTTSGYTTVGDSLSSVGISDGNVVSLGDGGYAICTFNNPITNGVGNDFAVFENSFDGNYLELGFVEVSSDGINFFRFPATSYTQDTIQTGSFGDTDPTKINNLAGKYKAAYGTPFDLNEMQGITGLDIYNITHVKIIDVVGSINPLYATYDKNGRKVNDPFATPYPSSGFDLDAVGVINRQTNSIEKLMDDENISVYPNPASTYVSINFKNALSENVLISLHDVNGKNIFQKNSSCNERINISEFPNGVYPLQLQTSKKCITKKIIISK